MKSYFSLALLALSSLEANAAFVTPHTRAVPRTTFLQAAEPEAALDVNLGEMLDAAKDAFGDSGDAVSDQLEAAGDLFSLPPEVLAGVGLVALAGIALAALGGGDSSGDSTAAAAPAKKKAPAKKAPKVDVSIPYDAAARMAFDAWVAGQEKADSSDKAYGMFKTLYEAQAVAEVTAKQKARDLANFDPSKPPPAPRPAPKKEAAPVAAVQEPVATVDASKTPFFAAESN